MDITSDKIRNDIINKIYNSTTDLKNISLLKYNKPIKYDMAIGIAIFNPANSKRIIMNYLYIIEKIKLAKIPYYVIELVFEDKTPEIAEAYHIYSNKYGFYKEQLYRILEKQIPQNYTKLCFIDADIIFDNTEWYNETSELLNIFDIVQPFKHCIDIDLTYTKVISRKKITISLLAGLYNFERYHTGYALAFQREWYNKIGFFDYAILGAGDVVSTFKFLNLKQIDSIYDKTNLFKLFEQKFKENPSISYSDGVAYHLYHGQKIHRQYTSRYNIIQSKKLDDLLIENSNGLLEFKDNDINEKVKNYFMMRSDDFF